MLGSDVESDLPATVGVKFIDLLYAIFELTIVYRVRPFKSLKGNYLIGFIYLYPIFFESHRKIIIYF